MAVYVTGDVHGMPKPLVRMLKAKNIGAGDAVIILGDNGLNWNYGWKDRSRKKDLCKVDCDYFVIRGNHDYRPEDYFNKPPADAYAGDCPVPRAHYEIYFNGAVLVEDDFPNIKYAVDGGIYNIDGKKCLVIGGGYSVDKFYRLMNDWLWIANEQLDENELAEIYDIWQNNEVDVILSHVAPNAFETYFRHLFMDFNGVKGGWENIDKSMERWMNKLLWDGCHELDFWYFAHYHENMNCGPIGIMLFDDVIPFGEKVPE